MTSFLASVPKKSNFGPKFWLMIAKNFQKLPCRTLLQVRRGHLVRNEGLQCVRDPQIRGSCHKVNPPRAKNRQKQSILSKNVFWRDSNQNSESAVGGGGVYQYPVGPKLYQNLICHARNRAFTPFTCPN